MCTFLIIAKNFVYHVKNFLVSYDKESFLGLEILIVYSIGHFELNSMLSSATMTL